MNWTDPSFILAFLMRPMIGRGWWLAESSASFVGSTHFCQRSGNSLFKAAVVILDQTHALSIIHVVRTSRRCIGHTGDVVGICPGGGWEGSSTLANPTHGMSVV